MSNDANEFIKVLSKLKENLVKISNEDFDPQDYDLSEEDIAGLSVTDDPFSEEDDASKWLKEQEGDEEGDEEGGEEGGEEVPSSEEPAPPAPAAPQRKKSSSGYTDWAPHGDYTDDQQTTMDQHMEDGYSHREAERLVGAYKGPMDFQTALSHTVRPSQPSEKMLGELKELAKPWLENADRHSKLHADPEKNPQKFAAGKMLQAHEDYSKDYNKDYHEFLSSEDVKDLKGRDRHKTVREWKGKWHKDNPEYKENIGDVSGAQRHYEEASQIRQKSLQERIEHITSGGVGEPIDMTMAEAAQHVGGQRSEEGGYQATTLKDPSVSFAQQNPELLRVLKQHKNPDIMDRFNRINAAKAAQGVKIGKKEET